jgi:hypothetical protein
VGFVVDKAALGQVFSEYFEFPFQSPFQQFLHHHYQPGLAQQAIGSRSAEGIQLDSTPYTNLNLILIILNIFGEEYKLYSS